MDKRVPEVRFKGFVDDWEHQSLNKMSTGFQYGLNVNAITYDGINKYLRITDIDDTSHVLIYDHLTSPNVDVQKAKEYLIKDNDILFARTGASVGKTYLYNKEDETLFFAGFLIRAHIKDDFSSEFIFQNTLTSSYKNFIKITSQRSGQPGVNAKEYSDFKLYIPENRIEQSKVGNLLKKIDKTILLYQRQLDQLEKLKKGLLQKLFPKNGQKAPNVRFTDFHENWEQHKFSDITSERTQKSDNGQLLSITINNGIQLASSLNRKDNSSENKDNYKVVIKGDIAYNSMRMWQGASGQSKFDGIVSPAYTIVIPNENKISGGFMSYLLKKSDMKWQFRINSQGLTSDTWNLKYPLFSRIIVLTPNNLKEQKKIEKLLLTLDRNINLYQKQLVYLNKSKQFFLQKLFI